MQLNDGGKNLIKQWEAFRGEAYLCSANVWTLGWGHTAGVREGDTCTLTQAQAWFDGDTRWSLDAVEKHIYRPMADGHPPWKLTGNEVAALVSWTFNVGTHNMAASTLVRQLIQDRDFEDVPTQLRRWKYASGKVIQGLINRREAEIELWLTPDAPAPDHQRRTDAQALEEIAKRLRAAG